MSYDESNGSELVEREGFPPFVVNRQIPGWYLQGDHPGEYTLTVADDEQYDEQPVVMIECQADQPSGATVMLQVFSPAAFVGKRVKLSAAIRSTGLTKWAGLFMEVAGTDRKLAFDNMEDRPILGTTAWQRYEVVLDVEYLADSILIGFVLAGGGQIRVADVRCEEAPQAQPTASRRAIPSAPVNLNFAEAVS